MNIPFPTIFPHMICPDWFEADKPYDEDAELTKMEEANKRWLNSITKKYSRRATLEKPNPEPMEEAETDDDGNDDQEESEESHDVDEIEELPTTTTTTTTNTESPPTNTDEGSPTESPEESPVDTTDLEVESALWPYTPQNE